MDGQFREGVIPGTIMPNTYDESLIMNAQQNGGNVFDDWFFPSDKEQRQMGQQLIMDRLEPKSRMEGLKAAGVNPLTAAAGIAGSPSTSPTPASSVNPIGDVAGALGSVAGAGNDVASAIDTLATLEPDIEKIRNEGKAALEAAGLSKEQAASVSIDNRYKDAEWENHILILRQQYDNSVAEWHNIKATHEQIMQNINKTIAETNVYKSQQEFNAALAAQTDEMTRFLKQQHDFLISHNLFINDSGIDGYIASLILSGASAEQFDKFIESYTSYRKSVAKGEQSAAAEESWNKMPSSPTEAIFSGVDKVKDVLKGLEDDGSVELPKWLKWILGM